MPKEMPYFVDENGQRHRIIIMAGPKIENVLDNLARRNERLLQVALREWMDFVQKQVRKDLAEKYQKSVASKLTDWELINDQGVKTIKPAALEIMRTGGDAAYKHLAVTGSFDVLNVGAIKAVNKFCSKLVTDVTANTKKGINVYVKHGIKEGYSMAKIARELRPLVGLTGNQTQSIIDYRKLLGVKRPDLTAAQVNKAVMRYTNKTHRLRMLNIATTETARAQNIGYCSGLEEVGVKETEFSVSATDFCEDCEALNGTRFPVGEAAGIIPVHPRCRCAMLPVISDKVISEQLKKPPSGIAVSKLKVETKIEPVDPPEEVVHLKSYYDISVKQAVQISQELRKTYSKQLDKRAFGEMENAILCYESKRVLATVDKQIVGAIAFHFDELSEKTYIDHIGTLTSVEGVGAELMRTVVAAAHATKTGIILESTSNAEGFYVRLGFKRDKKLHYVFEADFNRVSQIKEALGSVGRIREKLEYSKCELKI